MLVGEHQCCDFPVALVVVVRLLLDQAPVSKEEWSRTGVLRPAPSTLPGAFVKGRGILSIGSLRQGFYLTRRTMPRESHYAQLP